MKLISKPVTLILLAVFLAGLSVLFYPAVSQYWNGKVQSGVLRNYESAVESMTAEDYSAILDTAYSYNEKLYKLPFPLSDYKSIDNSENDLDISGLGMIGYISIDKIRTELPIYSGVSADVLDVACGHMPGTSIPVGGESTHSVLSAHRGLPTAKLFTDLDKLQIGDTFKINVLDKVLTYQVDQIKTVLPEDSSELQIQKGKDFVTLLTCTPYGINTHRLLVRGTRVETGGQKMPYVTSEAYLIDRLIVTPAVALPMVCVLILYVFFKPQKPKNQKKA